MYMMYIYVCTLMYALMYAFDVLSMDVHLCTHLMHYLCMYTWVGTDRI